MEQQQNPEKCMMLEPTLPELEDTTRGLKKNKVPGKDGITNKLMNIWDQRAEVELINCAVQDFIQNGMVYGTFSLGGGHPNLSQ